MTHYMDHQNLRATIEAELYRRIGDREDDDDVTIVQISNPNIASLMKWMVLAQRYEFHNLCSIVMKCVFVFGPIVIKLQQYF